jgi:hypothetical protein
MQSIASGTKKLLLLEKQLRLKAQTKSPTCERKDNFHLLFFKTAVWKSTNNSGIIFPWY